MSEPASKVAVAESARPRIERDDGATAEAAVAWTAPSVRRGGAYGPPPGRSGRLHAHRGLVTLQRAIGNAAVQRLMSRDAGGGVALLRPVQRYEAGEHAQFGGPAGKQQNVTVNGVTMTYGEMIAMADFFDGFEAMKTADPAKLRELVKLIQADAAKPGSVTAAQWQAATDGRYLKLAEDNTSHFAPSNPALVAASGVQKGVDHKTLWEKNHAAALELAQQGKKDEALAQNAFGDHFLTDAFSAGHLINKPDVMEHAKGRLGKKNPAFFDAIAKIAWANASVSSLLSQYETVEWKGGFFRPNIDSESRFSALLQGIYEKEPDALASVMAKLVHDQLDTVPGGVEVENAKGDKWQLSGDATLATSPKTLEIGQRAVAQSQQNIISAVGVVDALNFPVLFKAVWDYVPRPTAGAGTKAVTDAIAKQTDPTDKGTIAGMATLLIANITVIVDELVKRKKLKKA